MNTTNDNAPAESHAPLPSVGKAPDVRFSFANERTFLAWNRTALALVTAGLAITQLLPPFNIPGGRKLIGLPFIALGAVIAVRSYRHWEDTERAMRLGQPLPASRLMRAVALVVAASAVLAGLLAIVGSR